ncbi:hypothetical protein ASwh1_33 [Aeromonas phage Aswh_1]|nr:hypothetical protein ASwh1_33 [Aeromonas phage Aswh_1]
MMNLYAQFTNPNAGYDRDKDKCRDLELYRYYEVSSLHVHGCHTDVWLDGFDTVFNSVNFEFYEIDGYEYIPVNIYQKYYNHNDYMD